MRRAFVTYELHMVVAIVLIIAAAMFPIFGRARENVRRSTCQANLKKIALSFQQYLRDSDGYLPASQLDSTKGWADSIRPYLESTPVFRCPRNRGNHDHNLIDYFYNGRLSKLEVKKVANPRATFIAGEGNFDAPLNTSIISLPEGWRDYEESPSYRHLEGGNYAFVDGHVKWLKPEKVTSESSKQAGIYTFQVN